MTNENLSSNFSRRQFLAGAATLASSQLIFPAIAQSKKINLELFVADCIDANKETDAQEAVKEVLARAISDPAAMLSALGEPSVAGISVLHRSKTLTIFNAAWTPQMNLMPHNHLMWANIGIYTGREDNIFWKEGTQDIQGTSASTLFEGDVAMLPPDAIHSVTNPLMRFTGGVHIYGGDFFDGEIPRSQWNPETLDEESSNGEKIRAMFKRENERLGLL
jgi:predicted metal-dependent enzyme (double-stranded beta helix superfamily)